ncbi:MAG: hypothetical protein GY905_03950, partial [Gammaproteobacteria bacterium]|nr:hypothetical protein [Gammaproteobacteria bacterium]
NPGTTNTADAIYITGEAAGKNNFKKVDIQGVTTYAGEHWEVGGGDSGVFVTGAISTIIANNVFQGNRDLGYYGSALPNQTDDVENSSQTLYGNKCISCFHGLGGKRSISGLQVTGNTLYNCVRGVTIEEVQDYTVKGAIIGNNSFVMCQVAARINNCYGTAVNNNTVRYHGCLDSNGDAINQVPLTVVAFQETNNSEFCHNTIYGENPLSSTANPTAGTLFTLTSDSNVNKVADNDCSNWRRLGTALGDS